MQQKKEKQKRRQRNAKLRKSREQERKKMTGMPFLEEGMKNLFFQRRHFYVILAGGQVLLKRQEAGDRAGKGEALWIYGIMSIL